MHQLMLPIKLLLHYALYIDFKQTDLKITFKHFRGFAVNTMHTSVSNTLHPEFYCKFLRNVS